MAYKFYCAHCRMYVFGDDLKVLCFAVNHHNTQLHPMTYAGWSEAEIVTSNMYALATEIPGYLKTYAAPMGLSEWGTAKHAPKITKDDEALLKAGGVKW